MTKAEVARVLATAARYDGRKFDDADVDEWFETIGKLDYDTAIRDVRRHFSNSERRLLPVHLLPDFASTDGINWG
jgi:hypothetical protein